MNLIVVWLLKLVVLRQSLSLGYITDQEQSKAISVSSKGSWHIKLGKCSDEGIYVTLFFELAIIIYWLCIFLLHQDDYGYEHLFLSNALTEVCICCLDKA